MGRWGGLGPLTRLKQLSGSPLWQQLKLWLGRRLPILTGPVLRLSRISPSRSSSSPDPRKLLSKASSAHRSGVSSGLGEGVLSDGDSLRYLPQGPQPWSLCSGGSGVWGLTSPSVLALHFLRCPLPSLRALPLSQGLRSLPQPGSAGADGPVLQRTVLGCGVGLRSCSIGLSGGG